MVIPLTSCTSEPKKYVWDINLQLRSLRPGMVLPREDRGGGIFIVYLDTDEVAYLLPRGRYAVRRGVDLAGTPEMTHSVSGELLAPYTKVLVTSTEGVPGRLERWVTTDDYEEALPHGSDIV